MTDKEYEKQKKRVKRFQDKWRDILGLNNYRFNITWDRARKESAPNAGAATEMRWEYQEYDFTWYLPALADLDDEQLEECVIHEYCHVLNSPLQHEDTETGTQVYEHVTTTMQRAISWTYEAGKKDK